MYPWSASRKASFRTMRQSPRTASRRAAPVLCRPDPRQTLLCLSYSERRRRYGSIEPCRPSRFLEELPLAELHWEGREPERDAAHSRELAKAHLARLAALFDD